MVATTLSVVTLLSIIPQDDESLTMNHSGETGPNRLPATSQNVRVDAVPDGNAFLGCNQDSLPDASHRQQNFSSRSEIDLIVRIEVERRLRVSFHSEFHGAKCDIHDGILILRGNVSGFHTKQLAHEIARKVDGVKCIINRLHVDQSHLSEALRTDVPFHSIRALE